MSHSNYLPLARQQLDGHDLLWSDGTEFDSRSAWTYLLFIASYAAREYRTGWRVDALERGEFVASLRFLGTRWKWNKNRVARFLEMLEKAGRIAGQREGQHGRVYRVVNYDAWTGKRDSDVPPGGTERRTRAGQERDTSGTPPGQIKEGKEGKEGTTAYSAVFEEAWTHYPKRPNNSKAKAWRAWQSRLAAGDAEPTMLAGTLAYAAYVSRHATEPRFVKQAATFYGPDRPFADDYTDQPKGKGADFFAKRGYAPLKVS